MIMIEMLSLYYKNRNYITFLLFIIFIFNKKIDITIFRIIDMFFFYIKIRPRFQRLVNCIFSSLTIICKYLKIITFD